MIDKELLSTLATKYGTPLFVYDFNRIKERILEFKNAFRARKSLICYALKANSNLSLLRFLAKYDCGADCVSINEIRRALKAGIQNYKIIYSGVGKSDMDIEEAILMDILFINLESKEEMLRVENVAKRLGKSVRISVRVNPNIDAQTHPYISTGLQENKFGVDIEEAKRMYLYASNSTNLLPIAVHFHIGSQLTQLEPIVQSTKKITELIFSLLALKIDIKFIDIGGGIGIRYDNEETIDLYDYAQGVLGALSGLDLTVICEPGRYIVGDSGYLLSKVLYEKQNSYKRFVIIDAAMNDLIRPSLYGAYHKIKHFVISNNQNKQEIPPFLKDDIFHSKADVVGPICESSDYLAKDVELSRTKNGDLLLIHNVGAYGFSMSSNYNSRLRCAEVALINGQDVLIREREEFDDLLMREIRQMDKIDEYL